jgi:hypothetical protein
MLPKALPVELLATEMAGAVSSPLVPRASAVVLMIAMNLVLHVGQD